jgi:hypothetical protein
MAALDPALINDIARLRRMIDGLGSSSAVAAADVEKLTNTVNAIQLRGIVSGSAKQFLDFLTQIGVRADISEKQLRELRAVALQVIPQGFFAQGGGRRGFGAAGVPPIGFQGGAGQRGENITAEGTPDFGRIFRDPANRQGIIGGERAVRNVEAALDKYGGKLKDLTAVQLEHGAGVVRWSAQLKGVPGVVTRATITTNRFGQVLGDTQRRFRSFGSAVARDIGEVLKWGIAVAIIYTPIRKLGDLMREATQIQAKLADVQVSLGQTTGNLNEIFSNASDISRELGVSLEGVIDGYVLAFRAAGNLTNPTERAAAATALLRDSMLLAKLSGLDQAIALDTLVGALRQTNRDLDQGVELIDKWVAISKVANVSIGTLAESFAITSTAAENVGVTIDTLNGIIAAVAEVTTLSATESGNAVRAFISGFQKDQSERELAAFGIAVRDVNGELRAFTSVIEDIIARKDIGLISDRELAKISEVIGGGARRGAQVNAFLENYARVQELAAVSANASGDAAEALAIKMDTLQSASQNLSNAFSELSRAIGDDGGFLEGATDTVQALTGLIDLLTGLVKVLGDATPALIAFSVAFIAFKRSARLQGLADAPILRGIGGAGGGLAGGISPFAYSRQGVRGGIASFLARRTPLGGTTTFGSALSGIAGVGGGALGGAGIGAISAALGGNLNRENAEEAGVQIAGGIFGALVGGPLGAIVGTTIAEAFFKGVVDKESDLKLLFSDIISGAFFEGPTAESIGAIPAEEITSELTKLIAPLGSELLGSLRVQFARVVASASGQEIAANPEDEFEAILLTLASVAAGLETGAQADMIASFFKLDDLDPEVKEKIRLLVERAREEAVAEAEAGKEDISSAFVLTQKEIADQFGGAALGVFQAERADLIGRVGRGQAGVRELRELQDLGQTFDNVVNQIFTGLSAGAGEAALSYEDAANIIIRASEEERNNFILLTNAVEESFNALAKLREGGAPAITIAQATADLQKAQRNLETGVIGTGFGQRFKAFEQPAFIQIDPEATQEQLQKAVDVAREESRDLLETITPDEAEQAKVIQSWGELALLNAEIWEVGMKGIEEINREILEQVLEDMGLAAEEAAQISIQTPDITSAQFQAEAARRLPGINALIEQIRPLDEEDIGFIFKDNVTDILHADQLAIQLLLRDIKDLNEDQLEGIFNIPEGVTALIPFTGRLFFSDQPIGEAGGGFGALGENIDSQTDTLHSDLIAIEQAIAAEEKFLEEDALTRQQAEEAAQQVQAIDIDFEQLGRDFDAFKAAEATDLSAIRDFISTNPEFKTLDAFRTGGLEGLQQILEQTLPQSIPVTINTKITNPITVLVDGRKVQQAVEERSFQDLESATRRAGALGYIME